MNRHMRGGAGSCRIDPDSRDEMIHGTRYVIDRHACDCAPMSHRRSKCCRPNRWSSNLRGIGNPPTSIQTVPAPSTAAEGSGPLRIPPASEWVWMFEIVTGAVQLCAAIRRTERGHEIGLDRHHDVAVGLHQRLATDSGRADLLWLPASPGDPAIGRSAHQNLVVVGGSSHSTIAIAVVRTARPTVADDPILIRALERGVDADRILPGQPVGRPAHHDSRGLRSIRNR